MAGTRGRGGLRRTERRRRMMLFAELMAGDPWRVFEHARTAGLAYREAERLLTDETFVQLVEGLADAPAAEAA